MSTNNISLHRVLTAPPDRIYRAFTDPHAMASWIPPYGFVCVVHEMEVRPGGRYRMSFINFSTGNGHSFGGKYVELVPDQFIKYTDSFDDPNLPGEMTTSVRIRQVSCGTEINILQENIPTVIPPEMCYLGWQESLDKLKRLVEPNIPDA